MSMTGSAARSLAPRGMPSAAAAVPRNILRESCIHIIVSWDNVHPMMNRLRFLLASAAVLALAAADRPVFTSSERLAKLTSDAVAAAVERFGKGGLTRDKIALTVIDLADPDRPGRASYRGDEPTYPASVAKLFYLVAADHQIDSGALARTPELERALHDMIVDSSNDATHCVVDVLTSTTGGPELSDDAL